VKKHPELVYKLKEGYWWLDPAKQGTIDHTTAVVMDIVKRYDIDGVHFDDYFYPYPSYNGNADFPDSASYADYRSHGGKLAKGDWRRDAVNKLIYGLYTQIKATKPWVKFGLSPFGIWRPGFPESIGGFDQYDQLYADARLWLNKGWIDYFSPQLYWHTTRIPQSFPVLLGWWEQENEKHRHLWPGISVGRDTSLVNVNEILGEVMIDRGMLPSSKGIVHWSISSLTENPNMSKALLDGPYSKQALVPASPWLDRDPPAAPNGHLKSVGETIDIDWTHNNEGDVFHWVVYYKYGNTWSYQVLNRGARNLSLSKMNSNKPKPDALVEIAITAVDRVGNESPMHIISVPN
jgi:uncharacterized lipoprotein YddW (UPF0748 family)